MNKFCFLSPISIEIIHDFRRYVVKAVEDEMFWVCSYDRKSEHKEIFMFREAELVEYFDGLGIKELQYE